VSCQNLAGRLFLAATLEIQASLHRRAGRLSGTGGEIVVRSRGRFVMSRKLAGLLMGSVLLAGCGQSSVQPVPIGRATANSSAAGSGKADAGSASAAFALEDFVVGEPIRFEKLTVFPVTSRVPKDEDRFITLDEGLRAGTVEIREIGAVPQEVENSAAEGPSVQAQVAADEPVTEAGEPPAATVQRRPNDAPAGDPDNLENGLAQGLGNDVNSLIVVNRSDKPLYLMPGEVIIGGSQDRSIGNELVIVANSSPTRVPVFCVEHGRWGAKGVEETLNQINGASAFGAAGSSVSLDATEAKPLERVAREADEGKFVASVGQLGKGARLAVQSDKNQAAVWDKVQQANHQSGLAPISGAFTANYTDADSLKRLEPYLQHLQAPIADQEQIVGVLVAINGKIESIDVFESTPLFRKIWPKLLKSYSLDAVNSFEDSTKQPAECTRDAAVAFFGEALKANVASSDTEQGMGLVKRDGQHVLSFTSHVDSAAAPAAAGGAGGMGGMGGGVHFSGFAK
jgi:hypothetical protein